MESYYTKALPEYFINLLVIIKCPYPLMLPTLLLKNRIENFTRQIKKRSFWFRYLVIYGKSSIMQGIYYGVRVGVGRNGAEGAAGQAVWAPSSFLGLREVWGGERAVGRVQRPAAWGQRSDPWPFILTCICGKGSAMKIELKDLFSTLILILEMGEMIVNKRKVKQ